MSRTGSVLPQFTDDHLGELFVTLKNKDYRVGPEQLLAIHLLLARLAERDALPDDSHELAGFVGPIVCTTKQQQAEFDRLFDVWLGSIEPAPTPVSRSSPATARDDAVLVEEIDAQRRRARRLRLLLLGMFVLLPAVLLFVLPTAPIVDDVARRIPSATLPVGVGVPVAIGTVVVIGIVVVALISRRRFLTRREVERSASATLFSLSTTADSGWIPELPRDVVVRMRRREVWETEELDLEATVHASCMNGGRFDPRYAMRSRIPEYLVLIEATTPDDLRAHRVKAITERLIKERVYVDRYYFDGDARRVTGRLELGERTNLGELASRHPLHRLIVCSEGGGMISGSTGLSRPWVSMLDRWADRSLLTLTPVADWGAQERALSSTGLRILPCTPDGFGAVADVRLARRVVTDGRAALPPRYPDDLLEDDRDWIGPNQPARSMVDQVIVRLRAYLGETGFRWLSACAVYPEVKAPLTLHLGNRVAQPFEATILERLARLPWMRQAFMPDWFRRTLLNSLERNTERSLRGQLEGLLGAPRRGSLLEIAGRRLRDLLAMVLPSHAGRWEVADADTSPLRDRVYVGWMDERLAVRIPAALWRWLRSHRYRPPAVTSDTLSPDTAHHFQPEHVLPLRGVAVLLFGLLLAAALGGIYGALLDFVGTRGFGIVKPVISFLGFVFLFVVTGELTVKNGHIRGQRFGRGIGVLAAVVYLVVKLEYKFDFALDARNPLSFVREVYTSPSFGWGSYVIWALELAVLSFLISEVAKDAAIVPFCSRCRTWTTTRKRQYGPLENQATAHKDLLFGRFWHLYALSRVAADRTKSTGIILEHCQRSCHATTLITVIRRVSTRTSEGQLASTTEEKIVERLYVPARTAAELTEWIAATISIRPNLVPDGQPDLQHIVAAILPMVDDIEGNFYVYGDIPTNVETKARNKASVPESTRVAAIAVEDYWFIISIYRVVVFTDSGVYAYNGAARYSPYAEFDRVVEGKDIAAMADLKTRSISHKPEHMLRIIRRILSQR